MSIRPLCWSHHLQPSLSAYTTQPRRAQRVRPHGITSSPWSASFSRSLVIFYSEIQAHTALCFTLCSCLFWHKSNAVSGLPSPLSIPETHSGSCPAAASHAQFEKQGFWLPRRDSPCAARLHIGLEETPETRYSTP